LSRWFDPAQRSRLTAMFTPCYVIGNALSWALGGWLVVSLGWRYAFWIPGALLLAFGTFWYLLARDNPAQVMAPREQVSQAAGTPLDLKTNVMAILEHPQLRRALLTCFLSGMVKDSLTLWGPTYIMEQQQLDLQVVSLVGMSIPMAGAAGVILAGWIAHRLSRGEAPIIAGLALIMGLAALGLYSTSSLQVRWLSLGMLITIALGSHGMNSLLVASLPLSLGPKGNVSSAAATLTSSSYVGGGLSVALVGVLQDHFGWSAVCVWWIAIAVAIALLISHQIVSERTGKRCRRG